MSSEAVSAPLSPLVVELFDGAAFTPAMVQWLDQYLKTGAKK